MKLFRQSYMMSLCLSLLRNRASANGALNFSSDLPDQNAPIIIPKVFHTIWLDFGRGDKVFPKYLDNMEKLKSLHPGWELKLWNENEIIELIKINVPEFLETFQSYDIPVKKHDSARAVILYCFGGVYLDHDFIPLKNIEPLLKSYNFVVGSEVKDDFVPCNAFMASSKESPLLKELLHQMNKPGVSEEFVLSATGPAILKKTMLKYSKNNDIEGIKVYTNEFFFPLSWDKDSKILADVLGEKIREKFPNSYLIQQFDASWK